MGKTASPIRLDQDLMDSAAHAALIESRSVAEQIEYWARIGRVASRFLTPSDITLLVTGGVQLTLKVKPYVTPDPKQVFDAVEAAQNSGDLASSVTGASVRYQASKTHPGELERIDDLGKVTVGTFQGGKFQPTKGKD
ncbi:hypothetical protein GNX18_16840 [Microbulbifer sp. SH-1]|uniref:TA system antitoxin ParD family protein n=1 Tax=Microbulbifer sp. SH-1 TaxID=2681547 RepID=UPI001407BC27|nr:hypothetical protein [Microbulbifer sp. SH-1]QIL91265.1 hypothetical protein GNX18_16840 [Microbulbifer sp. SH-1]